MLKLHFKDNRQPAFWVTERLYCIGSADDNQLIIHNDKQVDRLHAKLFVEDNKFLLKDNNSSTGCFINGQRITQKEIQPGDIIKLGNTELIVLDPRSLQNSTDPNGAPWRLVSDCSWLPGKTFVVPVGRTLSVGRGDNCDISIPGTHLSRKHAELYIKDDQLFIKDLGSSNGTFLNDKPILEAPAKNGDQLRLDVYTFRLVAPESNMFKPRIPVAIDSFSVPVERKQAANEPKRWKTRPTSPGNRIEPTYNQTKSKLWLWIIVVACIGAAIIAKFLW
ncbi:MAG: FHA domain-containing protein [Pseudomonadota bacterium]